MLYLRAVSSELEREDRTGLSEKWTLTPVSGSGKVPAFVALLAPQSGMNIATLLDIQAKDRPLIEDLYRKKLLKKKQVMTYADFLSQDQGDIEDLFERELYVLLVNEEFKKQLANPIKVASLNANEPRNLRAIELFLADSPLKSGSFGHYRPARYFTENIATLWPNISDGTKDRFEAVFESVNALSK